MALGRALYEMFLLSLWLNWILRKFHTYTAEQDGDEIRDSVRSLTK